MLARPVQIEVWFSEQLLGHHLYASWRARVEREGGRIVHTPPRINGLCVFERFEGVREPFSSLVY